MRHKIASLLKRFTRTRIWGCSIFIRGKSSLMLTKSKSHFLFTVARECVRLIKIIHESSQGAKNTDQLFYTYTFWHIWFLLFHQKSDTFILLYRELKAYNFKGQKFFAKMWAKSSYYQIWTQQSTNYSVNATFSDEQCFFTTRLKMLRSKTYRATFILIQSF